MNFQKGNHFCNSRFQIDQFTHSKTGLRFCKVYDSIPCKTFSFSLIVNTPPENSKGIQHIIEHAVLCGSGRYNLKEPFKNLLESSFQTYLNAGTYNDHTEYPLASTNLQDFYNMIMVYLDAVFNPNLTRNPAVFYQEGINIANSGDRLIYNGVVYNEMLTEYNDIVENALISFRSALLKGSYLEYDSGGYPADIRELTYEQVIDYYNRYYCPGNMIILIHGQSPVVQDLDFLDRELENFSYRDYTEGCSYNYNIVSEQKLIKYHSHTEKCVCFGGIFGYAKDFSQLQYNMLEIIAYVLFNSESAIVTNYLEENGVCDEVICEFALKEYVFYYEILLQNISDEYQNESAIRKKIASCFRQICNLENSELNGRIDQALLSSVLEVMTFDIMEQEEDYGVDICNDAAIGLVLCGDPLFFISDHENCLAIKEMNESEQLAQEITGLIKKYFISNSISFAFLLPEKGGNEQFTNYDNKEYEYQQQALQLYHDSVDSQLELDQLPLLQLRDIDVRQLEHEIEDSYYVQNSNIVYVNNHDKNIIYLDFDYDVSSIISPDNIFIISLMQELLFSLITEKYQTSVLLNTKLDNVFGGIDQNLELMDVKKSVNCRVFYCIKTKFAADKLCEASETVDEILGDFEYSLLHDKDKIMQILEEYLADQELYYSNDECCELAALSSSQELISSKIMYAKNSKEFLLYLEEQCQKCEEDQLAFDELVKQLLTFYKLLMEEQRILYAATDCSNFGMLDRLEQPSRAASSSITTRFEFNIPEYIHVNIDTNYVAATYKLTALPDGCFVLFLHYLESELCWDFVRVRNGAYGCAIDSSLTHLTICSYRDPNIGKTEEFYLNIHTYVDEIQIDEKLLEKMKIGCLAKIELPETAKGIYQKMFGYFIHLISKEEKMQWISDIYNCTVEQFLKEKDLIANNPVISILGGKDVAGFPNVQSI